jgi:hypothetical protein
MANNLHQIPSDTMELVCSFMLTKERNWLSFTSTFLHKSITPLFVPKHQYTHSQLYSLTPATLKNVSRVCVVSNTPVFDNSSFPVTAAHLFTSRNVTALLNLRSLPCTLTHLEFDEWFDQILTEDMLPPSLVNLKLGKRFNQPISPETFENLSSLNHLSFGRDFNQPFPVGSLPATLLSITLGNRYDQPFLKKSLPETLTKLVLGYDYRQPIKLGVLPRSLRHLHLEGPNFDTQFSEGVLPGELLEFWHHENYTPAFLPTGCMDVSLECDSESQEPVRDMVYERNKLYDIF